MNRPAPMNSLLMHANAARKAGASVLPIAGFAIVKFPVAIRPQFLAMLKPDFAYENSLQSTGRPAAAANSWADPANGAGARGASVSRCVCGTAVDRTRMAAGGGRPGPQARTRRLLKTAETSTNSKRLRA